MRADESAGRSRARIGARVSTQPRRVARESEEPAIRRGIQETNHVRDRMTQDDAMCLARQMYECDSTHYLYATREEQGEGTAAQPRKDDMKTETKTKHSPTPWSVGIDGIGITCIRDAGRSVVCESPGGCLDQIDWDFLHIVRCVNSYDALVAACEAVLHRLEGFHLEYDSRVMLRAALRDAKGDA